MAAGCAAGCCGGGVAAGEPDDIANPVVGGGEDGCFGAGACGYGASPEDEMTREKMARMKLSRLSAVFSHHLVLHVTPVDPSAAVVGRSSQLIWVVRCQVVARQSE